MKRVKTAFCLITAFLITAFSVGGAEEKKPVDYVNPYVGNVSHLLVPTYPTVHLPNSMLRIYPERENYTSNELHGLPIIITEHRSSSAFQLSPYQGKEANLRRILSYGYDNEIVKPYYYQVDLDDYGIEVKFAPSHQSAMYEFSFALSDQPSYLVLNAKDGEMQADGNRLSGYQLLENNTKVYLYMEASRPAVESGVLLSGSVDWQKKSLGGKDACVVVKFAASSAPLTVRYGVSFISVDQARKNLLREIRKEDSLSGIAEKGRSLWNMKLGKIYVEGDDENAKTVFYTSLYRVYERMVCISEDGQYFSAYDGKVHADEGTPFYTDDWIWDTYRAAHPLRVLIEPSMEQDMIRSYLRATEQMENPWMPTFPEVTGDKRLMNSNHGVAMMLDAYRKGLSGFDLTQAYRVGKAAIQEKTLAPWSAKKAGSLDRFYKEQGYFPALPAGEKETAPEIHSWEKRQPVAVTLGTVYDEWCLAQMALDLGKTEDYHYFLERSGNYRKIFNPETKFFHPKDKDGNFIQPFDYRFSGGIGAREAYDENNGWVYRWDVPHHISDLVAMLGGKEAFVAELERMYNTPLGKSRYEFYAQMPDQTGNVGQFSMGNEPSLHIPYLYNYAGQPWRTQKRVRSLLSQWFRNDLMGIPGDEDGGGLTSFVVFSSLGFYPVTPGLPMYVIGSPVFRSAKVDLGNGKTFEVICHHYAPDHKYIQSAKLNGKVWNKSWFSHEELMKGGTLELEMGRRPNKQWAADDQALPPSFQMPK